MEYKYFIVALYSSIRNAFKSNIIMTYRVYFLAKNYSKDIISKISIYLDFIGIFLHKMDAKAYLEMNELPVA